MTQQFLLPLCCALMMMMKAAWSRQQLAHPFKCALVIMTMQKMSYLCENIVYFNNIACILEYVGCGLFWVMVGATPRSENTERFYLSFIFTTMSICCMILRRVCFNNH